MSAAAAIAQLSLGNKTPAKPWSFRGVVEKTAFRALDADSQLVERCLSGDQGAWEDLVKVHTRRVYSICYRFVARDNEAQDLTQDVFLRVFKTLSSFRAGEGSFAVWLTRLTRNLLIDHYRRTKLDRATDSIEDQLAVLD